MTPEPSTDAVNPEAISTLDKPNDPWFDWLLAIRHGGDAAYAAALQPMLDDIRDRVLDHAQLRPGLRLADVGCGDGFVGFGAIAREPDSMVTFVDISPALVARTRQLADTRGIAARCRFVVAAAGALEAIAAASVDAVLVRAVLAYVPDRAAAIAEFRRILRPGGRVSIVDPIFQDQAFGAAGLASQLGSVEPGPAARHIEFLHRCRSAHFPDSLAGIRRDPLTNYNERDLLRLFENAGFVNLHLRLHIDCVPALPMPWTAFLASSPRAGTLTMGEILQHRFTPGERIDFEQFFRSRIEAGTNIDRNVNAYVFADAP